MCKPSGALLPTAYFKCSESHFISQWVGEFSYVVKTAKHDTVPTYKPKWYTVRFPTSNRLCTTISENRSTQGETVHNTPTWE